MTPGLLNSASPNAELRLATLSEPLTLSASLGR